MWCMYWFRLLRVMGCVVCLRGELPPGKEPPPEIATLPEFYLDDLAELLLFLSQWVCGGWVLWCFSRWSLLTFHPPLSTEQTDSCLSHTLMWLHFSNPHLPHPHSHLVLILIDHPCLCTTTRFVPQSLDSPDFQPIATLIIILLCKKNYTRNPYLIAKFVEVKTQHWFLPFIPSPFTSPYLTSHSSRFTSPYLTFLALYLTSHPSPFTSASTLLLSGFNTHWLLTTHHLSPHHPVSSSAPPTSLTCPLLPSRSSLSWPRAFKGGHTLCLTISSTTPLASTFPLSSWGSIMVSTCDVFLVSWYVCAYPHQTWGYVFFSHCLSATPMSVHRLWCHGWVQWVLWQVQHSVPHLCGPAQVLEHSSSSDGHHQRQQVSHMTLEVGRLYLSDYQTPLKCSCGELILNTCCTCIYVRTYIRSRFSNNTDCSLAL